MNTNENKTPNALLCPVCRRRLGPNAPEGLCSKCLWASLLDPLTDESESEATIPFLSSPGSPVRTITSAFKDYEILGEIARGGMGVVYRARQISLQRVVALKMVLMPRLSGEKEMKRFRAEAEAAAGLEHPNIVPIYEIGDFEGHPYFTMKLIPGGSLADRLPRSKNREDGGSNIGKLAPRVPAPEAAKNAAALITKIARAVHHAHQRGVLHRDLKPSNILLDEQGEPLVTDFGLAKQLAHDSELTLSGAVLGTPAYIAPEQASGSKSLTTAADVYSIGAIFYELLAGRPPFQADTPLETLRQVLDHEPAMPRHLNAAVNRDLEIICLKCLSKDPAQRYASAQELAEDLERWSHHEPILARPISGTERLLKWCRRHPAGAALLLTAVAAPLAIIASLLLGNARVQKANHQSRENLYAADMFLADQALQSGNLGLARATLANYIPNPSQPAEKDFRGFEWSLLWEQSQGDQSRILNGFPRSPTAVAVAPDARTLAVAGRNFLWRWNLDETNGVELLPPKEPRWLEPEQAAALVARIRASPFASNQVSNVNPKQDELARWINPERIDVVTGLSFSHDGRHIISSTRGGERAVRVWNAHDAMVQFAFPALHGDSAVSRTGPVLAVGSHALPAYPTLGCVKLYDLDQRTEICSIPRTGGLVAFSGDGQILITAGWDAGFSATRVGLWSARDCRLIREFTSPRVWKSIAVSPNALWIASAHRDSNLIELWSAEKGELARELTGHSAAIHALTFSPDSQLLASAGVDQLIRLWSIPSGTLSGTRAGHTDEITSLAFFPDGHQLASAARDGTVRLWPALRVQNHALSPRENGYTGRLKVSPDNRWWTTTALYWRPREIGDTQSGAIRENLKLEGEAGLNVGFDNGGQSVVSAVYKESESRIRLEWRGTEDLALTRTLPLEGTANHFIAHAFRDSAGLFAAGQVDGTVQVWSARTGAKVLTFGLPDHIDGHPIVNLPIFHLAFSKDGSLLAATTSAHSQIAVYSISEAKLLYSRHTRPLFTVFDGLDDPGEIVFLEFSPDSQHLISLDKTEPLIRIWDARTGEAVGQLQGHQDHGVEAAFSPDGRTLASTGGDGSLKLWHLPTLREVATPMESGAVGPVAFSPDGAKLIVAVADGVRIFHPPARNSK